MRKFLLGPTGFSPGGGCPIVLSVRKKPRSTCNFSCFRRLRLFTTRKCTIVCAGPQNDSKFDRRFAGTMRKSCNNGSVGSVLGNLSCTLRGCRFLSRGQMTIGNVDCNKFVIG